MPASARMVPLAYSGYFTAAATAAGTLIGLLFVAVSFRDDTIFGPKAVPGGEALAITAFTGLVNAFFVSMLALIPKANIGIGAIVMAVISIYSVTRLNRSIFAYRGRGLAFALTLVAFTGQLAQGLALLLHSNDSGGIGNLAYLMFASLAVALQRAWALMKGKHLTAQAAASARPEAAPAD